MFVISLPLQNNEKIFFDTLIYSNFFCQSRNTIHIIFKN